MKTCSCCGVPKEFSEFYKNRKSRDGLQYICKLCDAVKRKKTDSDGLTSLERWYNRNPKKVRAIRLKYKYGITPADFDAMLSNQGGACAICGDINKKWCVDHDHVTGKVRAILCNRCNLAIGFLDDSAELATAAAEYLTHHVELSQCRPGASSNCPSVV